MIYLVSYDLKVPGKDYAKLYEVLRSASGWWHHLESTWIISTSETLITWHERIRGAMDLSDRFIIVDITGQTNNGWLPNEAWVWINANNHK